MSSCYRKGYIDDHGDSDVDFSDGSVMNKNLDMYLTNLTKIILITL